MFLIKSLKSLTRFEVCLWITSIIVVFITSLFNPNANLLSIIASLFGCTALIFIAKGNVLGQVLSIVFGILYGIVSLRFSYYGEMITYFGMSVPISIMSTFSWLRNPFKKEVAQVKVNKIKGNEIVAIFVFAALLAYAFYFILRYFNTANLILSTVSVATSFSAAYLTFRRSAFYALAYGANDVILILLWVKASILDISYLPMVICFLVFLINDLYGFLNWSRIRKTQLTEVLL